MGRPGDEAKLHNIITHYLKSFLSAYAIPCEGVSGFESTKTSAGSSMVEK